MRATLIVVFLFLLCVSMFLVYTSKDLKLFKDERNISNSVIEDQYNYEIMLKSSREQINERIQQNFSLSGSERIDFLLRMLDEDSKARGSAPTGSTVN